MSAGEDVTKQIDYLARALKAPRIREAATRLAGQARDAGWTHEEYLAAVLDREVSARDASGAQLRIRAAGSGQPRRSRTSSSTTSPDSNATPSPTSQPGRSWPKPRTWSCSDHQGPANPSGSRARDQSRPSRAPGPVRHRDRVGHPSAGRSLLWAAGRRAHPVAALRAADRR